MDDMTNIVPPVWLDVGWVMKIMFACINFATTQQVTTDVVVDTINKVKSKQDGNVSIRRYT